MSRYIEIVKPMIRPLFSGKSWAKFGKYVGIGQNSKNEIFSDIKGLSHFINSRASHVAQTSLYGYLRTRAGTRFPELFENENYLVSINIAKWQMWLACISDMCIFCGHLLYESGNFNKTDTHQIMKSICIQLTDDNGVPEDAGAEYNPAKNQLIERIDGHDWSAQLSDDEVFSESPGALVYWAPIADALKNRDEEIVLNSVRYRWIEVRRAARKQVDTIAIKASL